MDYEIKSLAMLKMEKNFIAVMEKRYPRQPYKHYDLTFLFKRLSEEALKLSQAIKTDDIALIREKLADLSNIIDYMDEVALRKKNVERGKLWNHILQ